MLRPFIFFLSYRRIKRFRSKIESSGCCIRSFNWYKYKLFIASTHRWSELEGTVQCLSAIRWSARDDDCHSLSKNWNNVVYASYKISNNTYEKLSTKCKSYLIQKFHCLETVFMALFWTNILQRVNITSKKLQSVVLHHSLIYYVESLRNEDLLKSIRYKIAITKAITN